MSAEKMADTTTYRIVTNRSLAALVVSITAAIVGAGTVHAMFVMPMVLTQAREQTEKMIEAHEKRVPPGSVVMKDDLQRDLQQINNKLSTLATQEGVTMLRERLAGIETRMLALERTK